MKKFGKIILGVVAGIVGVFVLAIVVIFFFTSDMVTSADEFFTAVKDKDMDKAYTYLSEDFQSNTKKADLENYLTKNAISKFKEANWATRSINGGFGNLVGSITTESGGVVPITLNFVKGDDEWKIYSIQKPSSGIQEVSATIEIPSEQEQVKLVSESMHIFAESVKEKSMSKFHSHVSNLWQNQFTVEKLDGIYRPLYNLGVDFTIVDTYSPQFKSKPSLDEDDVLVIAGYYPTKPKELHFEQKYIYEGLSWKLVGLNVEIK